MQRCKRSIMTLYGQETDVSGSVSHGTSAEMEVIYSTLKEAEVLEDKGKMAVRRWHRRDGSRTEPDSKGS